MGTRGREPAALGGLLLVVVVPVVVAVARMTSGAGWFPVSDVAQIEARVRDVGFSHLPLLGPGGRMEGYGDTGSHPGPLPYYLLAPVYRLLGADGNALLVASVALQLAAVAAVLVIAHRRGGLPFALAAAVVVGLLARGYGVWRLALPWNPYLPLLWWVVFLLALWSVLCGDRAVLPVVAFAGSFCAQAHVAYAGLVVGLAAGAGGYLLVTGHRPRTRRDKAWLVAAVWLGVLLWLPPLVEELQEQPGNLAVLVESFRHPYDDRPAFGEAVSYWAERCDWRPLFTSTLDTTDLDPQGSAGAGAVCLALWAAAAAATVRRRTGPAALRRLHAVGGAALLAGLVATTRIAGPLWTYLGLWLWGVAALLLLATVWTALAVAPAVGDGAPGRVPPPRHPRPVAIGLGVAAALVGALFTGDAARSEVQAAAQSRVLADLVGPTADGLAADPAACEPGCRYVVTWADAHTLGGQGYGLLVALEGRGFTVGVPDDVGPGDPAIAVGGHRVFARPTVDAEVHVAVGGEAIAAARARTGARELAYVDPNTAAERAAHDEAHRALVDRLRAEGHDAAADRATAEPLREVAVEPGMSAELAELAFYVNLYEKPVATFVLRP
jgi:hypothetical protein